MDGPWADFNGSTPDYGPLADAAYYGEDLSAANVSEAVAGLIAGNVTGAEATAVLDRLLRNTTDGLVYEAVDVTAYAVRANLPRDVVRILPWSPVANGPTGAVPQTFWEKVGAAATTAVNVLLVGGQLVLDGLVALAAFLVHLAEAIADWGMRAAGAVQEAARAALERVSETLTALFDWVVTYASTLAHAALDPLLTPLQELQSQWLANLLAAFFAGVDDFAEHGYLTEGAFLRLDAAVTGTLYWGLLGLTVAVNAVLILLYPYVAVSTFVLGAVVGVVSAVIVDGLLGTFSESDDPAPAYSPPGSMEEVVQRAEAYDAGRRTRSAFAQQVWTVFAALMAGNAAKWSAIALYAAADPTGRISGAVGILAGIIGAVLGIKATQTSDSREREVLGISGLLLSFASVLFSGLSIAKSYFVMQSDVRILAFVGLSFGLISFGISSYVLFYMG